MLCMTDMFLPYTRDSPDMGMPTWGGVIPEDEIKAIIKFLETVQKN